MAAITQAQQMLRAAPSVARMQQGRQWAAPLQAAPRPAAPSLASRLAAAVAQRRAGSRRPAAAVVAAATAVESLTLQPVRVIEGHVKLPGSKSLSNRILLLAALAEGTTTVENILVRRPRRAAAARRSQCHRRRWPLLPPRLPRPYAVERPPVPLHAPTGL